ncbi:MAG: hemolysin family protein [Candidatus Nanopelagicales bacterium]
MNPLVSDLLLVLFFVLLGGVFAGTEIALVSLRESQVKKLLETKGRRGKWLNELIKDPNRFLAAVQVGVTLAGFVSAGLGASQISPYLTPLLTNLLSDNAAAVTSFVLVTIVIAFFSLVLGELVPKRLALQAAERWAIWLAGPLEALARITRPFIWLLSVSTNFILRLLRVDPSSTKESISGEELRDLVAAHEELTENERAVIDDLFSAVDKEIKEVMTPRTEVDFISADIPVSEAVKQAEKLPHTLFPVVENSLDDVIGVVSIKQIMLSDIRNLEIRVRKITKPIQKLPGTVTILNALAQLRKVNQNMAIVVDEFGGTDGIVTLEDLVEELIGDIRDETETEIEPIRELDFHGSVEIDGLENLEDFAERTHIEIPEGPYDTVAGFMISRLGRLPFVGAEIVAEQCKFEVLEIDVRRISRIKVTRIESVEGRHDQ